MGVLGVLIYSFSALSGSTEPASSLLSLILCSFLHLAGQQLTFLWVSLKECDKAAVGQIRRGFGGAGDHVYQLAHVRVDRISSVGWIVAGHAVGHIGSRHGGTGDVALRLPLPHQSTESLPLVEPPACCSLSSASLSTLLDNR